MSAIALRSLRKAYGDVEVVRGIDLDVGSGEFVVLVGPSGCGKSTTLRMIAGLDEPSGGEIRIDGRTVNDVAAQDRDIAMVFQNYALFPHMTVYRNLSFGLWLKGTPKQEIDRRVREVAAALHIEALLERYPTQLSGGQRQRVAMGRAVVRKPKAFLFDEPLSNLDARLRIMLRAEIKKLHRREGSTIVYVTHDQTEAMTLADRIVVMNNGLIEQVGTPQTLYDRPATRFVAAFIGDNPINFLLTRLEQASAGLALALPGIQAVLMAQPLAHGGQFHAGQDVILGIRPEHLTERRHGDDLVHFEADVDVVEPLGDDTMVHFTIAGTGLVARCRPRSVAPVGKRMAFSLDLSRIHLFDPVTGNALPL